MTPFVPRGLAAVATMLALAGCGDRAEPVPVSVPAEAAPLHQRELDALYAFEERRRGETDFATLPPSEDVLGPDPYRIAPVGGGKLAGILRGDSAIVLIDADGRELARRPAPRSPSGLAVSAEGDVLVVGDGARELAHYRVDGDKLERVATLPVAALGIRDVALAPDAKTAYVVEEREGRLLAVALERTPARAFRVAGVRELGRCHGPLRVEALAGVVATSCLLDHAIEIRRDGADVARIHHDGPLWSFALHRRPDGGLLVAAGGVEDHPLVREDGGFHYIDSYVYLYRLAAGAAQPVKLGAVNTSALGAVTPKWIAIRGDDPVVVTTAGYASATLVTLTWRDLAGEPAVAKTELVPGIAAAALADDGTLVAANPLLDAWIVARAGEPRIVPVTGAHPARSQTSRVGELLFFTTLMAPWSSSEGKLSRFTCETCHHEGYVDGRIHFTGRGTIHAATKPLYGLFNNRPYFSRALDQTMTQMVHSEFKVANRHNGRDPWFAVSRADVPWLARVGAPAQMAPEYLREAFMTFLMDFSHRANPAADHARFTDRERAGAVVFRDRCASCHAARLIAEDASSAVAFERWESLVLSTSGPIVWSNAEYAKTEVTPYVHDRGTRVPSLRRLYKKWPYFTNGTAASLADVLERFAAPGLHDHAPAGAPRLSPDDRLALLAFLDLL